MGIAVQKTLSFILLIFIGVLLKRKIKSAEQIKGIKVLILAIALPATIFIALLKIEIEPALLFLPFIALGINFIMFYGSKVLLKIMGYRNNTPTYRTLLMLLPSFAPGLSCLPFVLEYLGDESLAHAALADVGNKVFVLIILYLMAMNWYYQLRPDDNDSEQPSNSNRVKELLVSLFNEPINMVIVVAILLLIGGFNLSSLPSFLQESISRMSALMTPMVLIFIGIAVKISKQEIIPLLQILFWRSGFAFLLSGILILSLPLNMDASTILLLIAFPQSACSFWPFAHMAAVNTLEEEKGRTFNVDLALNVLACSLPLSTVIILGIFSTGQFFASPNIALLAGAVMIGIASVPSAINWIKKKPAVSLADASELTKEKTMAEV